MRPLAKAALTASLTLLALSAAAPASAAPLGSCPGGEPICVYVAGSYPVTNPVVIPGRTIPPSYVPGPRVCDATGTQCVETWVAIPGVMVDSNGNTLGTLTIPGLGIGVGSDGRVTAYATTLPTFTPTGSPLGVTAAVTIQDFLVVVSTPGGGEECGMPTNDTYGPVTVNSNGCSSTVTIRL
jgi:hypothetical protein